MNWPDPQDDLAMRRSPNRLRSKASLRRSRADEIRVDDQLIAVLGRLPLAARLEGAVLGHHLGQGRLQLRAVARE